MFIIVHKNEINKYLNNSNNKFNKYRDDLDFIIQLFEITNDKNTIKHCSNKLLNNYKLIKYLITKFPSDIPFLIKYVDNYIINNESEYINKNVVEINIMMEELLNKTNNQLLMKYKNNNRTVYYQILYALNKRCKELKINREQFGMGFHLIMSVFKTNPNIIDYYAKFLIKEIFNNNDLGYEEFMHQHIKDKNVLLNKNNNSLIINIINKYDTFLGDYLITNLDLLDELKSTFIRLYDDWDYYNEYKNNEKIKEFVSTLHNYYIKHKNQLQNLDYFKVEEYIINLLNLEDIYKFNDYYNYIKIHTKNNNYNINDINHKKINFIELKFIEYGITTAEHIFNSKPLPNPKEEYNGIVKKYQINLK